MKLVCRNCESDRIASLDRYLGTCEGEVRVDGSEVTFEPGGYTELNWDSCEQIGWECRDCFSSECLVDEKDNLDATLLRLTRRKSHEVRRT